MFVLRSIRQLLDEWFKIETWDLNLIKWRLFEAQEIEIYRYISWLQVLEPTQDFKFATRGSCSCVCHFPEATDVSSWTCCGMRTSLSPLFELVVVKLPLKDLNKLKVAGPSKSTAFRSSLWDSEGTTVKMQLNPMANKFGFCSLRRQKLGLPTR